MVTQRYYIGMHSTNNLDDGYMGSGKRLRYSIRKYGIENHKKEIIEFFDTRELLVEAEKEIVTTELVNQPNCMNLVLGGGGFMLDDYHYQCSKKGNQIHNQKLENDLCYKNKWLTNMKLGLKKAYDEGRKNKNWGKNHKGINKSDEHKAKIRKAMIGKGIGENNSQYGTKWAWVVKNDVVRKIPLSELENYLKEGWTKGRKG